MSKVIVITGASSGIGEATAKLLAKQGNPVVLAARRASRLQAIVKDIEAAGGQAAYQETDVTDRQQVQSLADFALSKFGKIDVWMNNAGLMPQSTFDQLKVDEWDRMVDVNIKGVLYGIAAALPVMRKQQSGQFINLSSVAGHVVHAGSGVYAGTKFAVRAISDGLRQEEAAADSH
ncbi:MAG: SDR family oxidoreductase, partial [Schleiferilactobacillus harbinensis]|nr:SDR family oxidoreductase [Schleiferilactobacillus harbinensis]